MDIADAFSSSIGSGGVFCVIKSETSGNLYAIPHLLYAMPPSLYMLYLTPSIYYAFACRPSTYLPDQST